MLTKDLSNQRRLQEAPLLKVTWGRTHVPRLGLKVDRKRSNWGLGNREEPPDVPCVSR